MRIALIALLLTGCAGYQQTNEPVTKFDRDRYECLKDSAAVRDEVESGLMFNQCMRIKGWRR